MSVVPEETCPFAYPSPGVIEDPFPFCAWLRVLSGSRVGRERLESMRPHILADEAVTHIPNLNQRAPAAVQIAFDPA